MLIGIGISLWLIIILGVSLFYVNLDFVTFNFALLLMVFPVFLLIKHLHIPLKVFGGVFLITQTVTSNYLYFNSEKYAYYGWNAVKDCDFTITSTMAVLLTPISFTLMVYCFYS